jgi:hypothetical protein
MNPLTESISLQPQFSGVREWQAGKHCINENGQRMAAWRNNESSGNTQSKEEGKQFALTGPIDGPRHLRLPHPRSDLDSSQGNRVPEPRRSPMNQGFRRRNARRQEGHENGERWLVWNWLFFFWFRRNILMLLFWGRGEEKLLFSFHRWRKGTGQEGRGCYTYPLVDRVHRLATTATLHQPARRRATWAAHIGSGPSTWRARATRRAWAHVTPVIWGDRAGVERLEPTMVNQLRLICRCRCLWAVDFSLEVLIGLIGTRSQARSSGRRWWFFFSLFLRFAGGVSRLWSMDKVHRNLFWTWRFEAFGPGWNLRVQLLVRAET